MKKLLCSIMILIATTALNAKTDSTPESKDLDSKINVLFDKLNAPIWIQNTTQYIKYTEAKMSEISQCLSKKAQKTWKNLYKEMNNNIKKGDILFKEALSTINPKHTDELIEMFETPMGQKLSQALKEKERYFICPELAHYDPEFWGDSFTQEDYQKLREFLDGTSESLKDNLTEFNKTLRLRLSQNNSLENKEMQELQDEITQCQQTQKLKEEK
ncbi:hypothetical protein [Helicobacter fennelliae]|uniref:Uncharacterized protein n=2 Tax=Helicobacter fennelliae TaxID=215 RepID=T1DUU1_9HELI|nr:hypothetical protein [Helicobacter fennelliae]GAD18208.1 hypothetical protein HFN_1806 [Helicobacter fennelliae MRY12-0050]SQB98000.1 Uncharacterised protein [Helicobacter fennelliae]STP06790.1 Uncharacterised protein [Helicobacter fennelliae]STQ83656.1 Uncharacterised protein [Helicobacter fennelliae]